MGYLLFNVGCIECGVSSNVVGVFETKEDAVKYANKLSEDENFYWREGGQNRYEVFDLKEGFYINGEYGQPTPKGEHE